MNIILSLLSAGSFIASFFVEGLGETNMIVAGFGFAILASIREVG